MAKQEFILPVYNMQGQEVEKISLDAKVFDGEVNQDAVYQAVTMYRANKRKGMASTKTRGEVRGGGKKPWKQKGTGRARVGSIRSPLWRKGGVVFGPHPREFGYTIPEKIKKLALRSSLNAKLIDNNMVVVDDVKLAAHKTKAVAAMLGNLKISKNTLLIVQKIDNNIRLAARNIPILKTDVAKNANCYEVLESQKLIITKGAVAELAHRIR